MSRDYSMLRPFDLAAAKAGKQICYFDGELAKQVMINEKEIAIDFESEGICLFCGELSTKNLRMAPLFWLEDKPVYTGDVVYLQKCDKRDGQARIIYSVVGLQVWFDSGTNVPDSSYITWKKPKTKREGWINVYTNYTGGEIYLTQEDARNGAMDGSVIDTIKITWEE